MEQAANAGKVVINTIRGDIIINLHSIQAPQHCSLFLDWVANVVDLIDVPCSQRVIKNFYIQFYFDDVQGKRPPLPRLDRSFDRAGLCAFSNQSTSHFIITLDPCDALNPKYSIFGDVSGASLETLRIINELETDDDIPEDCYLITGIQILESIPGFTPTVRPPSSPIRSSSPSPSISEDNKTLNTSTENNRILNTSTEDKRTLNTSMEGQSDPTTPVITPESSLDISLDTSVPIITVSSSTITTTTTTSTSTSTNSETNNNNNNNNINNNNNNNNSILSNSLNSSILLNRSKTKQSMNSPSLPPPMARRLSSFQVPPSPKRQRMDSPQVNPSPMARSTTLILDQQQCLMASHFGSAMGGNLNAFPNLARSYSAPDMRMRFQPKWPKRLVIVRHGQSEQNACLDLYQDDIDALLALAAVRDCDIKLTEFGKWQAEQTGKYLAKSDQFDICFVSPYQRAVNTAELISKELPYKLKHYKDNWLREKEFGRLHGLNEKTVREKFPFEYEIRNRDGRYWYRFPGGENYCDVEMRVHCFLEKLSRDYAGRSVLVVTHQVPYKLFRALLQQLDEEGVLKLEAVHNCGVQEYLLDRTKSQGGRLKLKTFNHMAYNMKDCPPHLVKSTKET